jgi:hypothetical protein
LPSMREALGSIPAPKKKRQKKKKPHVHLFMWTKVLNTFW